MSFWEGLGTVLKSMLDSANEKAERMRAEYDRYRERYESCDDNQLLQYYKNSTGMRQVAIRSLLRERGYDTDNA